MGLVATFCLACTVIQVPRRKAGFQHKPWCLYCLGRVNQPYSLAVDRGHPENSKFPHARQGLVLLRSRPFVNMLVLGLLGLLMVANLVCWKLYNILFANILFLLWSLLRISAQFLLHLCVVQEMSEVCVYIYLDNQTLLVISFKNCVFCVLINTEDVG